MTKLHHNSQTCLSIATTANWKEMQVSVKTSKEEIPIQRGAAFCMIIIILIIYLALSNYVSESNMKVQREESIAFPEIPLVNTDTIPIFVHIPKTGGTSIEDSLHQKDIEVGRYLNYAQYPYKVADVTCSPWHKPPVDFVKNSFSVVREPFSRLESEFKWCLREGADWCVNASDNLNGYQNWIVYILEKARFQYDIGDCHLIPQWHFARWVMVKLPFSQLQKAEFWDIIRRYYNLTQITQVKENSTPTKNGSYADSLSQSVKRKIKIHFREDFRFLSQFW